MDCGPVTPEHKQWPSWRLAPGVAELTQGFVATGYGSLPTGRALFLKLKEQQGGAWLGALQAVLPITPAVKTDAGDGAPTVTAALALSWSGLHRMGLAEAALASFSRPFREGMMQEDRLRRLGDRRGDEWRPNVIDGGPDWSSNTPKREAVGTHIGAYDVAYGVEEKHLGTPRTVHALLLIYTDTEAAADDWAARVLDALRPHGVTEERRLPLLLDVERASGISREHFGFADGLSQPAPYDANDNVLLSGTPVRAPAKVQHVPLGEILIGYGNGHHERAPGPVVSRDAKDPKAAGLVPHPEAEGFYDLGLNGSYLVVRELRQDVAAFWNSMHKGAARLRAQDPDHTAHITAEWIAERVVGRDRDGHLLCPVSTGGRLPADALGLPDSDFLFLERDARGAGCPAGSHVRRAFPRDALASVPGSGPTLLQAADNHRILRRGRKYGPKIADPRTDDQQDRGLLFMCLNTDIARQFEFVQQTWLLNSDFATLYQETDPLLGPAGRMTLRDETLRRAIEVETFIKLVGGDYFFLPSLPALSYLATL